MYRLVRRRSCRRPVRGRSSTRSPPASRSRAGRRSSTRTPTCITSRFDGSLPSQDTWVPVQRRDRGQIVSATSSALWAHQLPRRPRRSRSHDYVFANGVVGKMVVYNMEERQRVKIVDYVGSKKVEQSKIDEELKKKSIQIRARFVHRPGADPQGRRRRARHVRREGLRVSPRSSRRSSRSPAAPRRST